MSDTEVTMKENNNIAVFVSISCFALLSLLLASAIYIFIFKKDIYFKYVKNQYSKKLDKKIKIGLLTNEIPPIVYGGVATWIVNYIDMFKDDNEYEVIPIYLAYQDDPSPEFEKYKNIRIIYNINDIACAFKDIDICINNIWIHLDTIKDIKQKFSELPIISVCHSLIQMEHITNMGSQYESTWLDQEVTFQNSDYVVLISEAEKKYYMQFNYNEFSAKPIVIYNSYKPKFDNTEIVNDYSQNNPGYIGRHVPRKRPELPLLAVKKTGREDIEIINMGVDFKNGKNEYWEKLKKNNKFLKIIPFSCDSKVKEKYWNSIGVNCITGIYEPFGYTMCETLDRKMPCIVQNIDGPSEIIESVKDHVITYDVDINLEKDVENFKNALEEFWKKSESERKDMAEKARKSLDKFRPEVIKRDWKLLFNVIMS